MRDDDILLLLQAVHLNLLLAQRSQLLFTSFHVSVNCFRRNRQIAHERQNSDAVFARERRVALAHKSGSCESWAGRLGVRLGVVSVVGDGYRWIRRIKEKLGQHLANAGEVGGICVL